MPPPTYVVVGHVTRDVVPGGFRVGGTATFAGCMALHLGERVGVVTSASPDFDFASALPGAEISLVPAIETSTFENVYGADGRRVQYVRAVASPLDASAIPEAWRTAPVAHLAPLTNEVQPGVEEAFEGSLVGATPQGWLRRWGADGRVHHQGWEPLVDRLAKLDAVVLSEEDVDRDEATIDMLSQRIPLLVVTRGARGGTWFRDGRPKDFPAFPTKEVDPTGAGDVFAAAFLIKLRQSHDPELACLFASCAASFSVEAPGCESIPTPEQIAQRLG